MSEESISKSLGFHRGKIILLTMKINLEGVRHLLCMGERAFKLDEHLGKVRVVQYTEQ